VKKKDNNKALFFRRVVVVDGVRVRVRS